MPRTPNPTDSPGTPESPPGLGASLIGKTTGLRDSARRSRSTSTRERRPRSSAGSSLPKRMWFLLAASAACCLVTMLLQQYVSGLNTNDPAVSSAFFSPWRTLLLGQMFLWGAIICGLGAMFTWLMHAHIQDGRAQAER